MEQNLKGKIAVVVGGGQMPGDGIGNGRATCINLARHGAMVVVVARHQERAQETVDMIKKDSGMDGWAYSMDVINRDQCAKLFADVKAKYGKIDIMVYNVGVNVKFDHEANTATLDDIHKQYDINTVGWVWCSLEAGAIMEKQETGGSMVCVSSIASYQTGTGISVGYGFYALSKAAMNKWCKLIARHWAPAGIRVNNIILGSVTSVMSLQGLKGLEGGIDATAAGRIHESSVPLKGGRQTVWETAKAIAFLVSDEARFVTGLEFVLDGGSSVHVGPSPELLRLKIQEQLEEEAAAAK